MEMSWTSALGALDDSLESALARRQIENSGLMNILQQQERGRAVRVEEDNRRAQIDENARWRRDQNLQRQEEALLEDRRARELQTEKIAAQAEEVKRRREDQDRRDRERREDNQRRDRERAQDRADRERERAEAKAEAEEAKRRADDPKLPNGVKVALAKLPFGDEASGTKAIPDVVNARRWVNNAWASFVKDHPDVDPVKVGEYLNKVYTQPAEDRQITVGPQEGDRQPIPGMPNQFAVFRGGKWIAE